ncbi:UNVERIFIED_CONTAM: hypothetical protein GTU68_001597, partial [Idotea baltica]|nr:hypothetical protein [Idotea baltica]
ILIDLCCLDFLFYIVSISNNKVRLIDFHLHSHEKFLLQTFFALQNGNVDVIANDSGERVTPAVVGFHDAEVVTGSAAKQGLIRHDKCSAVGALRAIGSSSEDDLVFPLNLKCQLMYDTKKPKYAVSNGERSKMITPEEVMKYLFVLLKEIAGSHSSDDKLPVVIVLPAWVSNLAVSVVHSCANLAGFNVIKTISQASAACLAYDLLDDNKTNMNVLIFHCGGTSIIATVCEIAGGLLNIKETSYSLTSSGDALTSCLVNHFAKEFFMKYKGDPLENRRSKRKLYNVSENCKHVLSTMNTAHVHVESLWEGVDFSTQLSRARFDGLIGSCLNDFLAPVKEALQRANLTNDQVDKVILTGGSCKVIRLQSLIGETFKNAEILKKFPADEILSIGATKEASFHLEGKQTPVHTSSLISCLSQAIFAKILESKSNECIFASGSPTHSRQSLSLECPSGPCNLVIYEANELTNLPSDDQTLAVIELNFIEASSPLTLQMDCMLKSCGSLVVKILESLSKTNKSFIIEAGRS